MTSPDEKTLAFDEPPGLAALATLESFAKAKMPNLPSSQARAAFIVGEIGIFADTSANLGKATEQIGTSFSDCASSAWSLVRIGGGASRPPRRLS